MDEIDALVARGDYASWIDAQIAVPPTTMVAAFDERRRVIVGALNQLPGFTCIEPGGAFYAFPNITGTGMNAKELQNAMLEKAGVATVAGTSFGIPSMSPLTFS